MSSDSEEDAVYCICRGPDDGRFMIGCDKCDEWYHGDCVGVSRSQAKTIGAWVCPKCNKTSQQSRRPPKREREISDTHSCSICGTPLKEGQEEYCSVSCTAKGAERMVRLLASGGLPKKRSEEEKVVKKRREQQQEVSAMRLRVAALMTEALAIDSSDRELCEEIGAQIEAALTEQLGDSPPKYATQTRSIKFNLSKNAQLRERVLSGELTPQQLVMLDTWDMAHESLAHQRNVIDAESADKSILKPEEGPVFKKTSKGLEVVGAEISEAAETADPVVHASATTGEPSPSPPAPSSTTATSTVATTSTSRPSTLTTPSRLAPVVPPAPWHGTITSRALPKLNATGRVLRGPPVSLLPQNLNIVGRTPLDKLSAFLQRLPSSHSKTLTVLQFTPATEGDNSIFEEFRRHFASKNRAATVEAGPGVTLHIIPVTSETDDAAKALQLPADVEIAGAVVFDTGEADHIQPA